MTNTDTQIEALLSKTDDELLSALACDGYMGAVGEDLLRRGREIYTNLKSKLRTAICSNERVISVLQSSKFDRVMLAAAIIDAISGYLTGMAAANVAALLIKEGVSAYCGIGSEKQ